MSLILIMERESAMVILLLPVSLKHLKCLSALLYYRLDEISFKVYRVWTFEDSFGAQVVESNGEELGEILDDSYIFSFTGRAVDLT